MAGTPRLPLALRSGDTPPTPGASQRGHPAYPWREAPFCCKFLKSYVFEVTFFKKLQIKFKNIILRYI